MIVAILGINEEKIDPFSPNPGTLKKQEERPGGCFKKCFLLIMVLLLLKYLFKFSTTDYNCTYLWGTVQQFSLHGYCLMINSGYLDDLASQTHTHSHTRTLAHSHTYTFFMRIFKALFPCHFNPYNTANYILLCAVAKGLFLLSVYPSANTLSSSPQTFETPISPCLPELSILYCIQ